MALTLTLAVHDLEETVRFYRNLLFMDIELYQPLPTASPLLLMPHGDAVILFRQQEDMAALHPAQFQNQDRHPWGIGALIELTVTGLQETLKRLEKEGIQAVYERQDDQYHQFEIWLYDPNGYLISLTEDQFVPA